MKLAMFIPLSFFLRYLFFSSFTLAIGTSFDSCESEVDLVTGISKVQGVPMAIAALMVSVSDNMCLIESGLFTGISNTTSSFHHVVSFMDTVGLEGTNASVFDGADQQGMPFDNTTNYWYYGKLDFGFNNVKSFHNRFNLSSNSTAASLGLDSTNTTNTTVLTNIVQNSTTTTNNNVTRLGIIHFVTEVGLPGWVIVRKDSVRVLGNSSDSLGYIGISNDITTFVDDNLVGDTEPGDIDVDGLLIRRKITHHVTEHGLPAWDLIFDRPVKDNASSVLDDSTTLTVSMVSPRVFGVFSPMETLIVFIVGNLLYFFLSYVIPSVIKKFRNIHDCHVTSVEDIIMACHPPDPCEPPSATTTLAPTTTTPQASPVKASPVSSPPKLEPEHDEHVVDDEKDGCKYATEFVPGESCRRYDPTHPCGSYPCAFTLNERCLSHKSTQPSARLCLRSLADLVHDKELKDELRVVRGKKRTFKRCSGVPKLLSRNMLKDIKSSDLYGKSKKRESRRTALVRDLGVGGLDVE
ncbi:hypothetical protein HDU76_001228 [Blyttiomyces sp. JEL0837]|nr:hypothetical protein HDU76_001228 [Blyttiomyces sp. JEL0837]